MRKDRRKFIKQSAFLSAGSLLVPSFLKALDFNSLKRGAKKLVIVQLSGGNDGLNTIVPFRNDEYYRLRPQLAIPKGQLLHAGDELGFNQALKGLKGLFDEGDLSIINSVGYPNPDRSHFRSMDIWHTASDADEYRTSGWLGNYLDASCSDCRAYQAIEVDDSLGLAMKGRRRKGLSITDPDRLFRTTQDPAIQQIAASEHVHRHDNVGYLYKTMAETVESAAYVREKSKVYRSKIDYPRNKFGKNLKLVAELINSGIETEIFYVSLGGFDTHANQAVRQQNLLKMYGDGMAAFAKDLKANDNWNDTLVMTFSEFGRRVAQNGSRGTDHGTANNLFLLGGSLKQPGFYNDSPNLTNLDDGDLKFEIDFRRVYASVLDHWLDSDSKKILRSSFETLKIF